MNKIIAFLFCWIIILLGTDAYLTYTKVLKPISCPELKPNPPLRCTFDPKDSSLLCSTDGTIPQIPKTKKQSSKM